MTVRLSKPIRMYQAFKETPIKDLLEVSIANYAYFNDGKANETSIKSLELIDATDT